MNELSMLLFLKCNYFQLAFLYKSYLRITAYKNKKVLFPNKTIFENYSNDFGF